MSKFNTLITRARAYFVYVIKVNHCLEKLILIVPDIIVSDNFAPKIKIKADYVFLERESIVLETLTNDDQDRPTYNLKRRDFTVRHPISPPWPLPKPDLDLKSFFPVI